ncbi:MULTISPECIES: serine/threonine transporter SstT [unclassified Halomonas]|uniref:serine/threonine transporter SstT n=1 Tax=unclassified Halomonas TaxID=2609666 RepID=UPI00209F32A6|nr:MULTISPECIES: serine/threonine transporter SstT [unclassified Halomonas]MCP1314371.1 serine/threonine transporter SstT [Halomonas sp. 707D7]MCP1326271.1 serine/threonine transporter SstT [Halomonas sp. 707D4]
MIATAQAAFRPLLRLGLISQIIIGIVVGALLALFAPGAALKLALLGQLFIAALQAVAPILVFVLVMAAIAAHRQGRPTQIRSVLGLYVAGTLIAALIAVAASFLMPTEIALDAPQADGNPPGDILSVLRDLLLNAVANPVSALMNANFIAILVWAVGLGLALRSSSDTTRAALSDLASAVTRLVTLVIRLAPLGILGLVAGTLAQSGFSALVNYAQLLGIIVGCMVVVALVTNPLLVYFVTRQNPYPLVWTCLRGSAITAFFTRSSAANIPVNLELCRKLELDADTYSISIPLGATINMCGAAITITVITLATTHTLGIPVDFPTALLLCVVSALAACGVSGVAGGSLMLIPMAASLFGIPTEVAMQAVAIGFVISVVQDATETALNSSTDVLFTAAACRAKQAAITP